MLNSSRIIVRRAFSQQIKSSGGPKATTPAGGSQGNVSNVTGLSSNCLHQKAKKEVKGGQYQVPEYFQFHRFSYTEAEIEMAKYRCEQPSAMRKD